MLSFLSSSFNLSFQASSSSLSSCSPYLQGLPLISWLYSLTGSCVYGNLGVVSWSTSCISVLCWVAAELYQVFSNHRSKNVAGFSMAFLIAWLLGDVANLAACHLTKQMNFQVFLAWWYLIIDSVLFFQYIYYTRYYIGFHNAPVIVGVVQMELNTGNSMSVQYEDYGQTDNLSKKQSIKPAPITIISVIKKTKKTIASLSTSPQSLFSSITSSNIPLLTADLAADLAPPAPRATSLSSKLKYAATAILFASKSLATPIVIREPVTTTTLTATVFNSPPSFYLPSGQHIGLLAAWFASLFYFASRIPQIHKNYMRKSTADMGMVLFIADFIGNSTYVIALIANGIAILDDGLGTKLAFWYEELPYILGNSLSVLGDLIIFIQAWYYGRYYPQKPLIEDNGLVFFNERCDSDYSHFNSSPAKKSVKFCSEYDSLITENRYPTYI